MRSITTFLLLSAAVLVGTCLPCASALSTSSPSEAATMARLILQQSLSSPSGKLTLSPELVIPEPTDATALLLQATEVTKLSTNVRTKAKANAAFVQASVNALTRFCAEQEDARGNFPGPVPAVAWSDGTACSAEVLAGIAGAGAVGIVLPVHGGQEIGSCQDVCGTTAASGDIYSDVFKTNAAAALEAGLQPIPEVCIGGGEDVESRWDEEQVMGLVAALQEECGGVEPVAVLFTVNDDSSEESDAADDDESEGSSDDDEPADIPLPRVPKALSKKVSILGSVRAKAGGGRMGFWTRSLKSAGFTGAVLRRDCVPGLTSTVTDLEAVGAFWSAAISDLKSVKSKSFGFRANLAGVDDSMKLPNEWYKYQKSVMESGALGDIGGDMADAGAELNTEAGDYRGF